MYALNTPEFAGAQFLVQRAEALANVAQFGAVDDAEFGRLEALRALVQCVHALLRAICMKILQIFGCGRQIFDKTVR